MIENLKFSTAQFLAAKRFDRYYDFFADGAEALRLGSDIDADIRGWRLDRVMLFDRRIANLGTDRSAQTVRRAQFDHFTLQLNLGGDFHGEGAHGFKRVRPGELLMLDMGKPTRTRTPNAHLITVSLARDLVEAAANNADHLNGVILPAKSSGLLNDFLVSLVARAPTLASESKPAVTRTLVELLRIALGPEQSKAEPARVQLAAARFDSARRFIERNLANEALEPGLVAVATNLSRATLYRLFEDNGGVAKYIQNQRLSKLRGALSDPSETRPFSAMAHDVGFVSESHASRCFYEAFSVRPADFRNAVRKSVQLGISETADVMRSRLIAWQTEVRGRALPNEVRPSLGQCG